MNKVSSLLTRAEASLTAANIDEPRANARALLAHALSVSVTRLDAFPDQIVPPLKEQIFNSYIAQKLQNTPLQYITKEQNFMGRILRVGPGVLIPRPETEELVEAVFKRAAAPKRLLDLCAGSGCIACALAAHYPSAEVTAADISQDALSIARQNAAGLKVNFLKTDLFQNIEGEFDVIVTNPPYIPTADLDGLSPEVKAEPRLALDGGADGLTLIKKIISAAPQYLKSGGLLAMEFGIGEEAQIIKLLDTQKWCTTEIKKDTFNINRFLFATIK